MTSTTSAVELRTAHGRLRRLAAERPLTTFLVLGLSLAYTLAFVWGLAYHGVIPAVGWRTRCTSRPTSSPAAGSCWPCSRRRCS